VFDRPACDGALFDGALFDGALFDGPMFDGPVFGGAVSGSVRIGPVFNEPVFNEPVFNGSVFNRSVIKSKPRFGIIDVSRTPTCLCLLPTDRRTISRCPAKPGPDPNERAARHWIDPMGYE
jgi:hypothetical protein